MRDPEPLVASWEPEKGSARPGLRLNFWPGGKKRLLGLGDYHGRRMMWLEGPQPA